MSLRICRGYGKTKGKCTNIAGTPESDWWCPECDARRRKLKSSLPRLERALSRLPVK